MINGININVNYNYVGLFGYATGTIKNVGMRNSSITGKSYIGSIAGYANKISNCFNEGSVSSNGTTNSDGFTGGIVGHLTNSISYCYNEGAVRGSKRYTAGVVAWCNYSGTSISNCYNKGSVYQNSLSSIGGVACSLYKGTMTNCYNSGSITGVCSGSGTIGGVIAYNEGSVVKNCYNTGDIF